MNNNMENLINVFNTLCQIQVSGYNNVNMLGGCMQTLKEVIDDMKKQEIATQQKQEIVTQQD